MQMVYNVAMDEMKLRKQIADNIRALRARQRKSQEQLAELSNTSQQYINQIENEKVNLSVYLLARIANALEVTTNDLVY